MDAPGNGNVASQCKARFGGCHRLSYDGEGLCICHSRRPDKDVQEFQREIDDMLARKDYNFNGFVFPGPVDFFSTTFDDAAHFVLATFQSIAYFRGATFRGAADFRQAAFQGAADFGHVTFQGVVRFLGTTFRGKADLYGATFDSAVYLYGATFRGAADFHGVTFQGAADFRQAAFQGAAKFEGDEGKWVFSREVEADFRGARFHQPEMVVFQHVFLGRARFLGPDVRRVDFTEVEWARRGGHFAVWDELAPEANGEEKGYALIGKLYRQLKHNYEEQRDPITAGDFHFGDMEMRRLSNPPKYWLPRLLKRNLSFLALYRWVSGYGENYRRALWWIASVIALFAGLFAYLPSFSLYPMETGLWHEFGRGLLYSIMCFLLRPNKPFRPVHLAGQYLSVAEGVIGASLIAMFVLALNRRFKR